MFKWSIFMANSVCLPKRRTLYNYCRSGQSLLMSPYFTNQESALKIERTHHHTSDLFWVAKLTELKEKTSPDLKKPIILECPIPNFFWSPKPSHVGALPLAEMIRVSRRHSCKCWSWWYLLSTPAAVWPTTKLFVWDFRPPKGGR